MATGGLAFMLVAMVSSILLITDFLFNLTMAVIFTAIAGAWFVTFWAALPFARRHWLDDDEEDEDEDFAADAAEPHPAALNESKPLNEPKPITEPKPLSQPKP
jgi:hypothetical protein